MPNSPKVIAAADGVATTNTAFNSILYPYLSFYYNLSSKYVIKSCK